MNPNNVSGLGQRSYNALLKDDVRETFSPRARLPPRNVPTPLKRCLRHLATPSSVREVCTTPVFGTAALLVCAKQAPKTLGCGSFWRTYLANIDYEICDGEHDDIFGAQVVEAGQFVRNVLNSPN